MTCNTSEVAACCSSASASFFLRSALAARRRSTEVLAFVVFERRPVMRVRLFAPLRAKVTSSACSIGCSPQAEDQVCIEMIAQARQVWVRPFTRPPASISPNGCFGISYPIRGSVRLDAHEHEHLDPFLSFFGHESTEVGRPAAKSEK